MPIFSLFFFNDPATTELYTLSLHDALPISSITLFDQTLQLTPSTTPTPPVAELASPFDGQNIRDVDRSEEHTSELQSRQYLVCRLLLEKKKKATRLSSSRA